MNRVAFFLVYYIVTVESERWWHAVSYERDTRDIESVFVHSMQLKSEPVGRRHSTESLWAERRVDAHVHKARLGTANGVCD